MTHDIQQTVDAEMAAYVAIKFDTRGARRNK